MSHFLAVGHDTGRRLAPHVEPVQQAAACTWLPKIWTWTGEVNSAVPLFLFNS